MSPISCNLENPVDASNTEETPCKNLTNAQVKFFPFHVTDLVKEASVICLRRGIEYSHFVSAGSNAHTARFGASIRA